MSKRRSISLTKKLAACLRELQGLRAMWDRAHGGTGEYDLTYAMAKEMTEKQVLAKFQWDHNILHGIIVNDEHWNLTPTMVAPHREKSKIDTGIVAKAVRIDKGSGAYVRALQAGGAEKPVIPRKKTAGRIKGRSSWPAGRKLQGRGFQRRER